MLSNLYTASTTCAMRKRRTAIQQCAAAPNNSRRTADNFVSLLNNHPSLLKALCKLSWNVFPEARTREIYAKTGERTTINVGTLAPSKQTKDVHPCLHRDTGYFVHLKPNHANNVQAKIPESNHRLKSFTTSDLHRQIRQ